MKYNRSKILSVLVVFAMVISFFVVPVNTAVNASAASDVTITLLETSDVHGHMVEVTDLDDNSTNQYRLAYMAKIFDNYREKGNVILMNGGDSFQGTPVSNFSEGKYVIKAFDAMDYDAHTLGNHEFDWGLDATLTKNGTYVGSNTPVLACNVFYANTKDRIPYTQDYTIVERDGKKIAIIGWADEYSVDIMAAQVAPYTISEDTTIVCSLAKELKDSKKADAVIVLAHEDAKEAADEFAAGYIDVVFGGHSHKAKNGVSKTGIPYVQSINYAYGYGKTTMTIQADGTVSISESECVQIYDKTDLSNLYNTKENSANLDQEIVKICDESVTEVTPKLNEKIANLTVDLTRTLMAGSLTSTMGNFITDMLLVGEEDVDFAFCNDGGIRCDFQPKQLTSYDIYTVSPFNNLMYKVKMKGSQVVKLLEQIVGNTSSNMQMSGLTAKYDLSKPEDKQVFDVKLADGTPIDLNATYTILTNEYLATGGNEYSVFLTDIISSYNTNELDNENILASIRELGKQGDLKCDLNARFVSAKMTVPSITTKKTIYTGNKFVLNVDNLLNTAKVTYSTSQKSVATVSKDGVVTAKKKGTATITTKVVQEGKTYTLKTKITVKEPSIVFTAKTSTIKVGKTFKFVTKATGVKGDITWTSSNKKVATVSKSGKVTAKKAGTTTITATIGKYSVSKKVTVKKAK